MSDITMAGERVARVLESIDAKLEQALYERSEERIQSADEADRELRDRAALFAMQGILASPRPINDQPSFDEQFLAEAAFILADAWMAERRRRDQPSDQLPTAETEKAEDVR